MWKNVLSIMVGWQSRIWVSRSIVGLSGYVVLPYKAMIITNFPRMGENVILLYNMYMYYVAIFLEWI